MALSSKEQVLLDRLHYRLWGQQGHSTPKVSMDDKSLHKGKGKLGADQQQFRGIKCSSLGTE